MRKSILAAAFAVTATAALTAPAGAVAPSSPVSAHVTPSVSAAARPSGTVPLSFSFIYRLDSSEWTQNAGRTSLTLNSCTSGSGRPFVVTLWEDGWTGDTNHGARTLTCKRGSSAVWKAPNKGDYYLSFTKGDDGDKIAGTASRTTP
ncbi:hypothetical protein C6Y14_43250 [Streptomyces dioscori]|uniref:Serine/threonine protein kinase n=1 Tax=Streptomyces dioscori TaxID=2109333 RepID=A0A2P8PTG3_9ACTN|nr:hypothetical protein [Streptomyces dioscori]PSM37281.1 hypothetical protein C6Y14_43250 [Streptomyces dioscori]